MLVCHLGTLPAPACHKAPQVAKVTLLATAASLVHFRTKDVISCSDNSPAPNVNPGFPEEPQTVGVQSLSREKPLSQMQSSRKPFPAFSPWEKKPGWVRAPQSFSHCQVSQPVDRRGRPNLVRCLGLVCAHSTWVWWSDQMEV